MVVIVRWWRRTPGQRGTAIRRPSVVWGSVATTPWTANGDPWGVPCGPNGTTGQRERRTSYGSNGTTGGGQTNPCGPNGPTGD